MSTKRNRQTRDPANEKDSGLIEALVRLRSVTAASDNGDRCTVSASPNLQKKIQKELKRLDTASRSKLAHMLRVRAPSRVGLNDGLIYPGHLYPLGTSAGRVRNAAANRAPLSGVVRVVVVVAEFSDKAMSNDVAHFDELFFSQGVLSNGSVREYFAEATNGIIDVQGEVVGPYELPQTLEAYANGDSGLGSSSPNARTMARDAAEAANPDVDFGPYDNDGDGYVDAFIVVHAGSGAEETGSADDIWSHKWVLSGGAFNADGTEIYAYLTVPEDCRIGVCCHELGHLLFGFPDLYDTDGSSEGVGNWCLMGGGSWNGNGDVPAHPCAWCKADQGWVSIVNAANNGTVSIQDVKTANTVYRLWKDGASSSEYFLVENRQRTNYDAELPGDGLLIWHIDEAISSNSDETHYKVALEQADGNQDLENGSNRGDAGDAFPGSSDNVTFDTNSSPNSKSYGNVNTCVSVTNIGASGPTMQARLAVKCVTKNIWKDMQDVKYIKENKEYEKLAKEWHKEKEHTKELWKDKPEKEIYEKDRFSDKAAEKPEIDKRQSYDKGFTDGKYMDNFDPRFDWRSGNPGTAQGEAYGALEPFIDRELRPDLTQGALSAEPDVDLIQRDVQKKAARAKRAFDTKPREG